METTQQNTPGRDWRAIALEAARWVAIVTFFGVMAFIYRKLLYAIGVYLLVAFCIMLGYALALMVAEGIAARFHTYGRILRGRVQRRWSE